MVSTLRVKDDDKDEMWLLNVRLESRITPTDLWRMIQGSVVVQRKAQ